MVGRAAVRLLDTLISVPRRVRRVFMVLGGLVSVVGLVLSACTVNPPPAPQSTDTPHNSVPPPPRVSQIIMGIDSIGAGFNPHLLSDLSPVNAAISALVLPSAFRPVPDPNTPTGSRWEMDPTLLVSAEVTSQNPFTVTYKIRPEAQWTDNAPIAADDFWYLWHQMVSQPGVVDPAGYDLITGVQSLEGGKQAVVTFSEPYPAWKELFNNILPAHIVKDVPGGFAAGLARALPVTGGQFRVESIDPQRDEILIARNDRYWGPPAKPGLILFRRAGAPAALADSVRNGDTQVAQVHGGSAAFAQLSAIPDVRTARIVTPRVMQLTLRATQPKLADTQVRKAILGLLDVDLLAAVGAGSDNTVTLDQAQIRAPSDPGYEPTAPPAMTTPAALALLEGAGYKVEPNTSASPATPAPGPPNTGPPEVIRGRISKDGQQLSLAIGVAANDPTAVAVANTAADQLRNVGIAATVLALDPVTLYRDALNDNRVDAIVGWHQAGGNLATRLAARYGCPALQSTQVPASTEPTPTSPAPGGPAPSTGPATRSATPTSTAPPSRPADPNALVQAPSNLTGICDRSIQSNIDAALNGTKNINDVITAVEPRLWNMSTVLPILQDTTIVAAGPSVQNVSLSGAVPVGIVGDAGQWTKTGP
ncbi:monoacyl phosphatidylinositol tetramannoside-binding protein [Mycobacterium avium subsp. paratuberculosis]|uniref:Probable monoacyl phosphatidylinositol tetramannoside-binding protein LpqW n=1 Tax=Mycolicibacterium paratuberculosis (strain ATCC BAA-968 / K-10) TaxID=262316 RepID=Q73WP5_MYCPA|nr:LpqW [Mycobacterium avium subsp. paratuberculosis K-10]AGL36140.1 lipoprotein LpqW [Mycobacterium avium subsp. paratuberculosis MAP4]AJK74627.1 monoacyl phosphatidylinositol tetramannoside-binding protein [Mycobacterium avium subsp. paratuberculosis]ETB04699.1 monoacyl phosphatidylinositol tetramannoside-binding protein [Mycobacterium avium subsp. paratuberculosis 10-4404]AJK78782.1 monoacyl phosphatidylinositol tetramannoside-binding protein [Mycobacterium avium subsp. paratuberculosis]